MTIDQVKIWTLVTCTPDTKVSTARALLDLHNAAGLLLMDGGMVMGSVDRADLKRQGLDSVTARDRDAIGPYSHGSTESVTGGMDAALVLDQMRRSDVPLLPVKSNGIIVGVVTAAQLEASLTSNMA